MKRPAMAAARAQRGAALLTAMIIVSLIATLAAAMAWRQYRAVQIEAADRARVQAGWVLAGALDWARLILREDARSNSGNSSGVDHLGEVWAVPLAEARLSTFLAAERQGGDLGADDAGPEAFLAGSIDDAQARYNLANVIEPPEPVATEERVLQRLASQAGLSGGLMQRWVAQLRAARHASPDADDAPLRPRRFEQLAWIGVDAATRARLEPWLVLLPERTPVNVNTAPREVLAALFDGMDLASAERLVQARRSQPFRSLDEIKAQLPAELHAQITEGRIATHSGYFFATGRLRLDERVMQQRSLLQRRGQEVELLQRERVSSLDEVAGGQRTVFPAP